MEQNNKDKATAAADKNNPEVKVVKSQADTDKTVINSMPVIIRPIDRTFKDHGDWWQAFRIAEQPSNANRTRLYDIYSTLVIDGHLAGIIEKRISSLVNKELFFIKDGEKVPELDDLITSRKFRDMMRELMQQKMWGITGFEFIPGKEFDFHKIPRKHIKIESKIITQEQYDLQGTSYENMWNVWVIGDRDNFGLLLHCAPYVLWKKALMANWADYIEVFGQPIMYFTYAGYNNQTREALQVMLDEAGGSLRFIMPEEAKFNLANGTQSNGTGELQDKFRNACNEELSVVILGATETTTSSKSSGNTQAKTHAKQQQEILKADMIDIANILNHPQFISILKSYGYPVEGGRFRFEDEADIFEQQARLSIITQVQKIGEPVDPEDVYKAANLAKPKEYDKLKAAMQSRNKTKVVPPLPPDQLDQQDQQDLPDQADNNLTPAQKQAKKKIMARLWHSIRATFFDPAP